MPPHPARLPLLLCAALTSLSSCAVPEGPFPSLAPRAVEKLGFAEPAAPPPAAVAPDPALDVRLADNARERLEAARAFDAGANRAERLARSARGAKPGSEPWLDAQTALAELDALRARHQDALGVLEDLASSRAQALQPAYPALEAALQAARAISASQTRRIDAIAASLAPA